MEGKDECWAGWSLRCSADEGQMRGRINEGPESDRWDVGGTDRMYVGLRSVLQMRRGRMPLRLRLCL